MALKQLQRCANEERGFNFLTQNAVLFDAMLAPFFDEEHIGGYEIVNKTLVTMGRHFPVQTVQLLFSEGSKYATHFDHVLTSSSETIRIRLLELFGSLSTLSADWFALMEGKGYVGRIFDELDTEDLLARLNAFQLLGKVCSSDLGMNMMNHKGVPQKLLNMLDLDDSGLNGIVLSNAITLVGEMAAMNDNSFTILIAQNPRFMTALHQHIEHDNDEVAQSVLFAIARIASTPAGIAFILQEQYAAVVRDWLEFGHSSNAEMRGTTFYTLSLILDRLAKVAGTADMAHAIYDRLGFADYPSIEVLNKNLTGGMSELKYAALTLLKSTLLYAWGLEDLVRFNGLTDWLLNRSTENLKKGHELKYEVIKQAIEYPDAKALLGLNNYHNFLEYVKLGVYYQKAEAATAIKDEHA